MAARIAGCRAVDGGHVSFGRVPSSDDAGETVTEVWRDCDGPIAFDQIRALTDVPA